MYSILIEFGISMKLTMLIKMYLCKCHFLIRWSEIRCLMITALEYAMRHSKKRID
jgi:hypothetical protein